MTKDTLIRPVSKAEELDICESALKGFSRWFDSPEPEDHAFMDDIKKALQNVRNGVIPDCEGALKDYQENEQEIAQENGISDLYNNENALRYAKVSYMLGHGYTMSSLKNHLGL